MSQVPQTHGKFTGWLVRAPGSPHGDPLFFLRESLEVCETLCPLQVFLSWQTILSKMGVWRGASVAIE